MKAKLKVVKIGSGIIDNPKKLKVFLTHFAQISTPKILVHGGGAQATEISEQLNIPSNLVNGRRITYAENLKVVTMVYAGLINKNLTAGLQQLGCNAIGLTGADANCISAKKRPNNPIDFGFVGDVSEVNHAAISNLLGSGLTPVFCAITHNGEGQLLNTNADTVASEIAIAMSKHFDTELNFCFEKKGVLMDVNDDDSMVSELNPTQYRELLSQNLIFKGMIPKLDNCFYAIDKKVNHVTIGNELSIAQKNQCTSIIA